MTVRVDWDRTPVSVHHAKKAVLESLILHLRNKYGIRKRSLVMEDREGDGFLFFIYQPCNPNWILEFTTAIIHRMEEE